MERKTRSGATNYLAQIVRRKHQHTESRVFRSRKLATAWATKREREIDLAIAEGRPLAVSNPNNIPTLGDAIQKYIDTTQKIGRSKEQCLRTILAEYRIVDKRCDLIDTRVIAEFAQQLADRQHRGAKVSPATVLNYLTHFSAVFQDASTMWGYPLDVAHVKAVMRSCKRLGITAKPDQRDRRPSIDELDRLLDHFDAQIAHRPKTMPMSVIVLFALISSRRLAEITRLRWADYDPEGARILVRDMKHPGDKVGNDVWCHLPDPCCAIINSMPRVQDDIFPFDPKSISANFTRACAALEIDDLHFHDLRHEASSRLAEMGWTVPQMASVTGHRSWSSLQRYTHVRSTGDKFAGWARIAKWSN